MTSMIHKTLVLGALMASWASAQAALTTFVGIRNTTPTTPAARAPSGAPLTQHDDFTGSQFVNVTGTESFTGKTFSQGFSVLGGAATVGCLLPGDPLLMIPDKPTCSLSSVPALGRYDTSGDGGPFLMSNTDYDPLGPIVITFTDVAGNSAFGFYGMDIGDFGAGFSVILTDLSGNKTTLPMTSSSGAAVEGNLRFFGFYDDAKAYRSVTFVNNNPADVFAIDDLIVGNFVPDDTGVPEPMSILLALSALAAAGGARRLRR